MDINNLLHVEMINPISWTYTPQEGEFVAQFEAVASNGKSVSTDGVILTIPLHEDFYDVAKEYCRQYKIHIENKLK